MDITEVGPVHQRSRPGTRWTTINASEQMPGVLTPLGFTFWIGPCDRGTKGGFRRLGILARDEVTLGATPDERVGGAFFGRWVANVDEFRRLADLTPGVSGAAFEEDVFGSSRPDLPARVRRRRYPLVAVLAPATVVGLRWEVPRAAAEVRDWWREFTAPTQTRDAVSLLREAMERTERGITLQMIAALVGQAMFDKLGELADKAGRPDLYLKLCSGYGESEESRMISALLDIAHGRSSIEAFLHHYGARCPGEVELSARSWRENPGAVAKLVAKYRTAENRADPHVEVARRSRQRVAAERELLAGLPGTARPAARLLFRLARTYIPLREEGKSVMVTPIDGGRFAARLRGRELVTAGAIDDPEDVFYLTLEEILTDPPSDARRRIEHRRRLAAEYWQITVPTLWTGTPDPVRPGADTATGPDIATGPDPADSDTADTTGAVDRITGIGAASGIVEGYARVLTDPEGIDELDDHEILVCGITDPSWAPAFYLASAVVIDIGGLSSHGAIVCRELGLPCVINTVVGTRAIRTGDRIRVDGDAGVVTRLGEAVPMRS